MKSYGCLNAHPDTYAQDVLAHFSECQEQHPDRTESIDTERGYHSRTCHQCQYTFEYDSSG